MSFSRLVVRFVLLVFASSLPLYAQDTNFGLPPFGSFEDGKFDVVNELNLNVLFSIPIVSTPGRGRSFRYAITFNNPTFTTGSSGARTPIWITGRGSWNLSPFQQIYIGQLPWAPVGLVPTLIEPPATEQCVISGQLHTVAGFAGITLTDPDGTAHPFPKGIFTSCPGGNNTQQFASDGSGYFLDFNSSTVFSPSGTAIRLISFPSESITDTNGNQTSFSCNGSTCSVTDSIGRIVLQKLVTNDVSGNPIKIIYSVLGNGGSQQTYTVVLQAMQFATNFQCSGILEDTFVYNEPVSLTLPNGKEYLFSYEPTTGRIQSVTLPTGAVYQYSYPGPNDGVACPSGVVPFVPLERMTRTITNGSTVLTKTYNLIPLPQSLNFQTTVTTSATPGTNFTTVITSASRERELTRKIYAGSTTSGAPLRTTNTTWLTGTGGTCTPLLNCYPATKVQVLEDGQTNSEVDTSFAGETGKLLTKSEYDFSTSLSTRGPLLRATNYSYLWQSNLSYASANILETPCLVTVYGPGSVPTQTSCTPPTVQANQAAQTTYGYDENNGSPQGVFGNQTSVTHWLSGGASPKSQTVFNTQGMPTQKIDPKGNATQITYDSTGAFPSQIQYPPTSGIAHNESFTYDANTGLLTARRDQNDINANRAGTTVSYDALNRSVTTSFPDGGQTTNCYTDLGGPGCTQSGPPYNVVTTTKIDSSQNKVQTTTFDGLGEPTQTQIAFDTSYTATTYDALGRTATVYNPTHCNPPSVYCVESTWGYTAYSYDALNRVTSVREPDTSTVTTSYSGNCTTVTDEAGKTRKSCSDALGRLTVVTEDPTPGGQNIQTTYSYDALDNLTGVVQNGSRNRAFVYDSLSRLTSATNPESGTIIYTYDADGNLATKIAPAPNQIGTATVTTTYTYDALNRNTLKSYSDGTPSASFVYDSVSLSGVATAQNTIGRLVYASTSNTGSVFSYDSMGRAAWKVQCTPMNCGTGWWAMAYAYDANGDMTSYSNGWGKTFTQGFDANGRFYTLSTNWVDATHPGSLAYADWRVTSPYAPNGALRSVLAGNSLEENIAYNNRGQACHENINSSNTMLINCGDTVSSGNIADFTTSYGTTTDNGDVLSWTATIAQIFNRSYTYDSLNRLKTMADSATSQPCKGLSWTYDPWGNRTAQTTTAGSCFQFPTVSINAHNQFVPPYVYDAAGNLTSDGTQTYTYDAENRIIQQVNGGVTATYVYDAFGRRVKKTVGTYPTEYMYTLDGQIDSMMEGPGGHLTRGFVYLNGSLFVEYYNNSTYFVHQDHLGSTRLLSSYPTPTIAESDDYYPFGELNASGAISFQKFTGKERDSESGLDNFGVRYDSSSMGRFMSADPLFISPERLVDPQLLNLYSYVRNNPLSLTDPTGLDFYLACQSSDHSGCGQVQNGSDKVWVQGQTVDGKFQATDVDMNDSKDASAGYHDQFGNQYTGTFDEKNGVSFTSAAGTSTHSQFIDGSDQTNVNGGGAFTGIEGRFFSDCGGSCEARGSLYGSATAFADAEAALNKQSAFMSALDRLSGAHKAGSQWKDSSGYVHMLNPSGQMELHFEGHPTGVDVQQFVLHMVGTIRDAVSGRAAEEKNAPLP